MKVEIIVTGYKLAGYGFKTIHSTVQKLIKSAQGEILIIAYAITTYGLEVLDFLEDTLKRGVSVKLIIDKLDTTPIKVRDRIDHLLNNFPGQFIFKEIGSDNVLHGKVMIFDRNDIIIGSANLTLSGLVSNHEISVWIQDRKTATEATRAFEKLLYN